MAKGRFEIVRTDAEQPWHARFRAANGRIVWTTEQYVGPGGPASAIQSVARAFWPGLPGWPDRAIVDGHLTDGIIGGWRIEVRDVDERTP